MTRMPKRTDINELMDRMRELHGGKYAYDASSFSGTHNKMRIICPKHGEFWQTPNKHMMGRGCPKCNGGVRLTTEEFMARAKAAHGDRYDYSKAEYVNASTPITIICPIHGEFRQKPYLHIQGYGCPACGGSKRLTREEFIDKASKLHGGKYDYSKVEYVNNSTDVTIICPRHGEFRQQAQHHLNGSGCPYCKSSHMEDSVARVLDEMGISYARGYKTDWLGRQHLDFFIADRDVGIECQGVQHTQAVGFFGGEERLKYTKELDEKKRKLCSEHGINLKFINFNDKIEKKLLENLLL